MTRLVRFGLVLSIGIAVVAVVRGQQPAEKSLAAIKTAPEVWVRGVAPRRAV